MTNPTAEAVANDIWAAMYDEDILEGFGHFKCNAVPIIQPLIDRAETAEAESKELGLTIELASAAYHRALDKYREMHPNYPESRYPDASVMFSWDMADRDECIKERDELRAEAERLKGRIAISENSLDETMQILDENHLS